MTVHAPYVVLSSLRFLMLQVRHDAKRDSQPYTLARALPRYQFVFQPAMSYPENHFTRVEEGLAVYSRWVPVRIAYVYVATTLCRSAGSLLSCFLFPLCPDHALTHNTTVLHIIEFTRRYPILSHKAILLPRDRSDKDDVHQRACLRVDVLAPAGVVQVFVTHLSLR